MNEFASAVESAWIDSVKSKIERITFSNPRHVSACALSHILAEIYISQNIPKYAFLSYLNEIYQYCEDFMHKKIMEKAAKALTKDDKRYGKEVKKDVQKGNKAAAKHHKVEQKEAKSAAKDLKKRAKKAHE